MDDFERRKKFGSKGKIQYVNKYCEICVKLSIDTLAKISHYIYAYSFFSEHSKHFFISRKKKWILPLRWGGVR